MAVTMVAPSAASQKMIMMPAPNEDARGAR
jgi:hypothetical protein